MKQLIGFLLFVGLVAIYWKWILAAIMLVLIVRALPAAWREWQAECAAQRARREELVARGEQQHAWAMAGDPRGTFGAYPPAV